MNTKRWCVFRYTLILTPVCAKRWWCVFRYTLVMVYYALCVVMLMLVRPLLSTHLVQGKGTRSIYAALYFLPILLVTHAVFAGVLCQYLGGRFL